MTDAQLRDEVMTIFLAGHETTANALTWTLHLLSLNPEVAEKLFQEVTQVLGGRAPTMEDLPNLKYTHAVLSESMRIFPPVWVILRKSERREATLLGHRIEQGSFVALCQYLSHRDPRYFPDPERFDPERFLGEQAEAIPRFAYFPFSGGPRICIGNTFAMMEGQLILAMAAQRYRFEPVPSHKVVLDPSVTLRPKTGMPLYLRKRQDRMLRTG